MDFTTLSAAVDFSAVLTAIGVVAVAVFGVKVSLKGISMVSSALNR